MKRIARSIFYLSILAGIMMTSCAKEDTTTTEVSRSSLTGQWMVYETSKKNTYEVTIEIDPSSSNGIQIINFAAAGQNVKAIAYLSGTQVSLATNELLSNGWIVNGTGTVTGTTRIDWPYTLHDGANQTSLQAVFTKK
ncbi:MAG: hypothetical protein NTU98_13295 [Bacteroidetes bacterium]|nr:hypothetical protein [Bacteroidota bacterium]